jgi:Uma2 family endonuclease
MSTLRDRDRTEPPAPPAADPYRYGWRDVFVIRPDGTEDWQQIPLTLEDLLHPQMGDHHVHAFGHDEDLDYLKSVLKPRLRDDPSAVVLSDCGVQWDKPELRHHSPDIAVIRGVRRKQDWSMFDVAEEGVRPALIIEVTSPDTRSVDLGKKVKHYARAGVPQYVIVDAKKTKAGRRLKLIDHRLGPKGYERVAPDPRGRVWLESVGLWLGIGPWPEVGGERLVCYDPTTDEPIPDIMEVLHNLAAEARARTAAEAQAAAEARARAAAEAQAAAEARARAAVEDRLRDMEAELRRLRGDIP